MSPDRIRREVRADRDIRAVERIDCMLERPEEFHRYLYANGESLVNYNHARIEGEPVSTAHVASTVNQLVNWRMCKKQLMRWLARWRAAIAARALSFLITLSAVAESQGDRQVATGFEDLYFLERTCAVFRIVRGRRTMQSP